VGRAGCQRADLSHQTKQTEARICTELTTVNQTLVGMVTASANRTQTLEQAADALKPKALTGGAVAPGARTVPGPLLV
jgi:hypothetical protein